MDHGAESATTKHHTHCGCGGSQCAKQGSAIQPSKDNARPAASALDILDERFARGEIDKAEYAEKKQLISERASAPKADQPEQALAAPKSTPRSAKRQARRR